LVLWDCPSVASSACFLSLPFFSLFLWSSTDLYIITIGHKCMPFSFLMSYTWLWKQEIMAKT
jgi:hypothetical protein